MKSCIRILAVVLITSMVTPLAHSAVKYWDLSDGVAGANPGPPSYGDGTWDTTSANWNTNADGSGANTTWADSDEAVFSAGSDLQGGTPFDGEVKMLGDRTANALTIEEGKIFLNRTANEKLILGTNPAFIKQGAYLQIPNLNIISAAVGHVLTIDGGTLENTIVGIGSGIWTSPTGAGSQILLTSNGGKFVTNNTTPGSYSIMAYGSSTATSVIGMTPGTTSATLHKTGLGEFRALNNWTFTDLDVQQGLYRINGTGGGDTGFGAVTGTVHVADAAGVGTSIAITSPATRSFILEGTPNEGAHFVVNAGWTINGPISGTGGLALQGTVRPDTQALLGSNSQVLTLAGTNTYQGPTFIHFGTLAAKNGNAIPDTSQVRMTNTLQYGTTPVTITTSLLRIDNSETIGSLTGGTATVTTVQINGVGVELTTGVDNSSTAYDGILSGTGNLIKAGNGTFSLNGTKSYTGDTKVAGGTLSTNSASLDDAADVYVNPGAILNLNFAGTDTVDSLFLNNIAQAVGTWGAPGSGATHTSSLFTGAGLLQVTTQPVVGVPGDYNNNGVVDAADYVLWRNGGPLQNEVDTPGTVNAADYDAWRARFGNTSGSGSSLGAAAVPEPATLAMLSVLLCGLGVARRRDR